VGHARFLRGLPDAARDFVHDDVVMGGVAAQEATQTNNGIVFLGLGKSTSGRRNLERARNADDFDVVASCATPNQSVEPTSKQSLSDELVEARDDNAEAFAGRP